jgi:hypothetical protein
MIKAKKCLRGWLCVCSGPFQHVWPFGASANVPHMPTRSRCDRACGHVATKRLWLGMLGSPGQIETGGVQRRGALFASLAICHS